MNTIQSWENTKLNEAQMLDFASKAMLLRDSILTVKPEQLLQARRSVDIENDNLWKTFNRVQENLIRGGVDGLNEGGRRRSTKAVSSIDTDMRINRKLWTLADSFAQN